MDLGAIVALAALWGYTERYPLLYTGNGPFGLSEAVQGPLGGPVGLSGLLPVPTTHGTAYWGSTA